jgi:N-sulfoglucosamine sulfohydrolase
MTRRTFAGAAASAAGLAQSQTTKPNIVLVLSDDHSYPFLSCYGSDSVKTPNIDRFAAQGMRYDNAFQAAPQCVPSRTALVTGRSPVSTRMGRFNSPLPADVVTLPELLRDKAGYFTGICRRNFHLDGNGRPGPVNGEIFARNEILTWQRRVDFLNRSGDRSKTGAIIEEFLDKKPVGKPFFLWVNFNDPHHVWDRATDGKATDPTKLKLPKHLPDLPGMRDDLARHCDEINRMDEEFGTVMSTLERRGFGENTLVVFMGDNGMAFPHGKGSLYDPGLHVPLAVRWPGKVKPAGVSKELVSGEDVTPTLLEAAGLTTIRPTGRSFLAGPPRKYIFGARLYHGSQPFSESTRADTFDLSRCVRSARYKLIYNCTPQMEYWPVDSGKDAGWQEMIAAHAAGKLPPEIDRAYFKRPRPVFELYDLETDPSEFNNLAGKAELAAVQRELTVALQEKMIIDYDFLPLPLGEA